MTILISHQAAPLTFYNKIGPMFKMRNALIHRRIVVTLDVLDGLKLGRRLRNKFNAQK